MPNEQQVSHQQRKSDALQQHYQTLDDLTDLPRWVTWREELRATKDGQLKPAKIPYNPNTGRYARIPGDQFYGTRQQAEQLWRRLGDSRPGGFGIVLGPLDNGALLAGVDVDRCIDEKTGNIHAFAIDVLDRFDTYAEISPSGLGLKLFFLMQPGDVAAVRGMLGDNKRKAFVAGEHREIAFDWARYYTVTNDRLDGSPETLAVAAVEDVRWLLEECGPRFQQSHSGARNHQQTARATVRDESGSGYGFRFMGECKSAGDDYTAAKTAILADNTAAGEWARRSDERQLQRAWDNAAADARIILSPRSPFESAEKFVDARYQFEGCRCLAYYRGDFYEWTGTHWNDVDGDHLRSEVYIFLRDAYTYTPNGDIVPFDPNIGKVNQIIDALKADVEVNAKRGAPFWFDDDGPDPANLIACRNGLLDITTRELLPPTPLLFNTSSLPFDYDPDAPHPKLFCKFLRELWPGDAGQQERQTLWEIFGLLLTPDTSFQKIFLFVGPKRSGKGTLARVLTGLLGRDNVVAPTLGNLGGRFGLQSLINKRAAIISDARLGPRTDAHVVVERLLSISGEDNLTAERKYKTDWTGRFGARFVVISNELPRLPDSSGAFPSRLIALTLQHSFFGREDQQLTAKLLTELPGILNVALRGLKELQTRGHFKMPQSSIDALQQVADLASPIGTFLRDWCVIEPTAVVPVAQLYDAWRVHCLLQGRHPGNAALFGRDLSAACPEIRTAGRHPNRRYVGIHVTEEGWAEYWRSKEWSSDMRRKPSKQQPDPRRARPASFPVEG